MKISILPEHPFIFLGQKFTLQITISDCESEVRWISAQITGKTKTQNNQTNQLLHNIVKDALGGPQNAPYFGHVMSGSRLIANNFSGSKTFCLTILAENIPPSYYGEGVSISYELMIACQTSTQIDKSHIFPLHFIAPFRSVSKLENCQSTASFSIDSSEAQTSIIPFNLACPFSSNSLSIDSSDFVVKIEDVTIARVSTPTGSNVGKDLSGIIDLSDLNSHVNKAVIKLIRNEKFSDSSANNSKTVSQKVMNLNGIVMKRFNLPVPYTLTADFETDLVTVSYSLEFVFSSQKGSWKIAAPFKLAPPEYSITRPRNPIMQ
ncbi:hypothetical protein TRFO_13762 [Tritrichomonas foetus]|uniref:Arrestin-like N-terminal domain-containing protein n=1 Tax=Tritrichomonas foetus TaxID=1144522 RepID=A0A1J4KX12_9EUKA|nr:hypothetical protein TRFO_13762 [Tritrichomonas foetus]|eukprot:OHT15775.1 hypothetical protein TRFO_13762 [Tritrichomonas foetus]